MFPPSTSVRLLLSKFLAEHVKGQMNQLILVASHWIEAPQSSQHVGRNSSVVSHHKNLLMLVSVDHVLKGLPYLHLTLWLLRDVCYADRGSLPQSVRQWWG